MKQQLHIHTHTHIYIYIIIYTYNWYMFVSNYNVVSNTMCTVKKDGDHGGTTRINDVN